MLRLLLPLVLAGPLFAQGFTPEEAVKRMKLPDGFRAVCVAYEPMIRQPLSISFDNRGRLWVLQYLQYPNPAGLKPLKQDQYLRTVWDKVPDAPPKGPKGLDRITICSDPDANGVFTKSKDFVTGLNLASGFCLAPGGVYVVQPPYLLHYPDKDEDDVPDGDPEVLLSGFGMEDTHSLANSLQFGPDGWLYGAAGSTSTCKIKNPNDPKQPLIEFQQGVWRFHPKTKKFELFSEGGGNTYGLDFDRNGQCIAGTNWGGFAMLHHFQGAYYVKGFSKHGPLHNPYAYGYFDHVPYKNFKGGHVTCGGILYEADAYPKEYRGQYIAGNLLSNAVYWHKMTPKGTSFTAEHGGELLEANDTWFRPVDLQLGPDGCVYVADWYDRRAAHLDPVDNWDKTNGRVYRIEYTKGERRDVSPPVDLRKKTNAELVDLLKHPNICFRRHARELIVAREAEVLEPTLRKLAKLNEPVALEALWCLIALDWVKLGLIPGVGDDDLLKHPNEAVRAWVVRHVGDHRYENQVVVSDLVGLAKREKHPAVLAQLAATAKLLPDALHLIPHIANHSGIEDDPHIPLLCWWALESRAGEFPGSPLGALGRDRDWTPTVRRHLLERLARRYAADGTEKGDKMAGEMLKAGWFDADRATILRGIESGLDGRTGRAPSLDAFLDGFRIENREVRLDNLPARDRLRLLTKLGDGKARSDFAERIGDTRLPVAERMEAVTVLSALAHRPAFAAARDWLAKAETDAVREALYAALGRSGDANLAGLFLAEYPNRPAKLRTQLRALLLSRPAWALALFQAWDAGEFPKADLAVDHGRTAVQLGDKALTAIVEKHFGKIAPATAGEKQARIAALNLNMSRAKSPGDPAKGKLVFTKTCAACHQLHGEGTKIGPDLTTADRKNRLYMLASIVDPSGYIRPEYISYTANTGDGRALTGMVLDQSPEAITLASYVNGKVEKAVLAKRDIDKLDPSPVSIMPEKLLDTMTDEEIRDLFAYLGSDPKANPDRKVGGEKKYKIAIVSGSLEYKSDESLTAFAKLLEEKYPVECVMMFRKKDDDIANIQKLAECDLAIFFTRRLTIDGDQLKAVKDYCASGKPVIGIRTASHGFQKWLEMDAEVFGGSYKGHFGAGPKCEIAVSAAATDHPVLKGFKPFASAGSLYKNPDYNKDLIPLLTGTIPKQSELIAWVREREVNKTTQRVFYTSLGHPDDFKEAAFNRLLLNALGWCLKDEKFAK